MTVPPQSAKKHVTVADGCGNTYHVLQFSGERQVWCARGLEQIKLLTSRPRRGSELFYIPITPMEVAHCGRSPRATMTCPPTDLTHIRAARGRIREAIPSTAGSGAYFAHFTLAVLDTTGT